MEETLESLAIKLLLNDHARSLALGPLRKLWWINRIEGALTIVVLYDLQHLCRALLKLENNDVEDQSRKSYRALLVAAELGRCQIIKLLLEQTGLRALIEADRDMINTPVAWVAWSGNRSAVRILLHSANLISIDTPESSSYSLYENQKLPEHKDDLLDGIRKLPISVTLPLIAVLSNAETLQKALEEPGVDIEERDPGHKKTALHHASHSGRTGIVRILIAAGASCSAIDGYGETPLHYAAGSGNLEVVKLLVYGGADLFKRNRRGELPTDLLGMRPGDTPCPVHQDERWEETNEFLISEVLERKIESRVQKLEFAKKYNATWREFNLEARRVETP